MLKEIIGYSAQGVIWYQGETDDKKPQMYGKLFSAMIACWRRDWKEKNAAMDRLPFLFVQLAPFGTWRDNSSESYPVLRCQQEFVSKSVQDVYMTCISDIGNVYDIHPKVKKPVGQRLAQLAVKYIYGMDILADLIPPVLDGTGGLLVKRENILKRLGYAVGSYKKKRVIIVSDVNTEADDPYAIVHHLLSPSEEGIVACNYEQKYRQSEGFSELLETSMMQCYEEGKKFWNLWKWTIFPC